MPAVLVHGVPSTSRMWVPVRGHLSRRDIVTPDLPGFGCPLPSGFDASKEAYVDWLIAEIERLGAPVDLVGHDWGAILVVRVAARRPDLVRTWAMGSAPVDREYVWHRIAQAWQTPERGEEIMTRMQPAQVAVTLAAEGMPADLAQAEARFVDDTMKSAILRLYRSGIQVGAEWGQDLPRGAGRGLVYWGDEDPYAAPEFADRLSRATGAHLLRLPRIGHWLPHQAPAALASALESLWAGASAARR